MRRTVQKVSKSVPTMEGAGVHLRRAFGFTEAPDLDPFLLLDDFHSNNPDHYLQGFPWHPHRGIETITYVLHGEVEHGDSLGNKGIIRGGDVQWMTAGNGIIHQEMPKGDASGLLWGFQLWANLPASHKMMAPRYREITKARIPAIPLSNGGEVRIICGEFQGQGGPVRDIVTDPSYLDISLPRKVGFKQEIKPGYTVFAYVIDGKGYFDQRRDRLVEQESLVVFSDGEEVYIESKESPLRFLLISGRPLKEPVAWRGPIVMNTQEELQTAFEEYQNGTFLRHSDERI